MNNCSKCGHSNKNNGNCMAVGEFQTAVPAVNCQLLAEYEDTGLTPDEVQRLIIFEMATAVAEITEFDGVPIQRLKELAAAEKSGEIETLRHGHWMYKYKVRGGIQHHTGEDIWGNVYTIQCDERYEINEPYCSECHKLNDGSSLDWCPNCGAKMDKEAEYARVKTLPLSVGAKMDGDGE